MRRTPLALPPGPRGWPLIGNALNIPAKHPWKVYLQWSQDFRKENCCVLEFLILIAHVDSDVLCLRLPGASFVILNSAKAVQDLLGKRSVLYSDRFDNSVVGF